VRPLSSARQLLGVALAGGLGGLINATLCYAGWPVSVTLASFHWHVYTPTRPRLGKALIVGTAAGVLGSLWFWIGDQWYFSLLHGTVWGCLVGLALSKSGILPDAVPAAEHPDEVDEVP